MSKGKNPADDIVGYLTGQNRPYSAIDIFNNLHKLHGKTLVEKTLESLADDGRIKRKLNGKQKVYVADQSQFAVVSDDELRSMNDQIKTLTAKLCESQDANRKLEMELRSFSNALSTEEAKVQVQDSKIQCSKLEERLLVIKSNANAVSPQERTKILQSRMKYVKEWRKRKRINKDILDAILEGYPKSKKELYEEIGIETDEDHRVSPPNL